MGRMALIAVLLVGASGPGVAAAQDTNPEEVAPEVRAAAREAFRKGVAEARRDRWEEARQYFERAYDLVPLPAILLNLAGAQRQTEQLVESAASYRKYLEMATEGKDAERRPLAEEALREVEAVMPRVRVRVRNLSSRDEVRVDDTRTYSAEEVKAPLGVNPGSHAIRVVRDGEVLAGTSVDVSRGTEREVQLSVPPAVPGPKEAAEGAVAQDAGMLDDEPDDERPLVRNPWLWTGVGGAVVGAVVLGTVLATKGGAGGHNGSFPPGSVTIR